jgi:integrase
MDNLRATLGGQRGLHRDQRRGEGNHCGFAADDQPENTVLDETELRRRLPKRRSRRNGPRRPAIAFAAYTGARRGEVLGVKWTDLDLDNASVTIRASLSRYRASRSRTRRAGKMPTDTPPRLEPARHPSREHGSLTPIRVLREA